MEERPIIYNTEMVKAVLDGRKIVTRRPVKRVQIDDYDKNDKSYGPWTEDQYGDYHKTSIFCPFGKISDRLYVRETWQEVIAFYGESLDTLYAADYNENEYQSLKPWKPSIYMPKRCARIWLEITDVRVERVQEINNEDCMKEGIKIQQSTSRLSVFVDLWDSIYKNWSSNPWVWVIEFKVVKNGK